jgi:hypothetical protein
MKISSVEKPLNPAKARNCFLINQFATPGLGSLMAGKIFSGLGQLLLALAGFGLVLVWFGLTMKQEYNIMNSDAPPISYARFFFAGAFFFAASWFWSLGTSLNLMRRAKTPEPPPPGSIPPRITKPPPKM